MKVCRDVEEWVEQNITEEIRKQEQRCKKWPWPLSWFCSLVTFIVKVIVTVLVKIIRVVCEIVTVVLNVVAAVINWLLALPLIGWIIRAVIRFVVAVISYIVGLLDGVLGLVGIRITKHLSVTVIPLCVRDSPLAQRANLEAVMAETARVLYSRAKIRVHVTFRDPIRNPPENALRLGTEVDLILDELWLKGSWHQLNTVKMFESNLSSLLSIGAPVVVYVIQEVGYDGPGTVIGASGGPFTDWVAVERDYVVSDVVQDPRNPGNPRQPLTPFPPPMAEPSSVSPIKNVKYKSRVVAHEICHALGLVGHANPAANDLMVPGDIVGDYLSPFQVGIIRSSAHVTFL